MVQFRRWLILVLAITLLSGGILLGAIVPARAEGSRNLFSSSTGFRANLEWRTNLYAGSITRRTLLKVYARQGEFILLGSSAVGVNNGDIWLLNPGQVPATPIGQEPIPPSPAFRCSNQRSTTGNPNQGVIANRNQELAGPDTIANPATGTAGGSVPGGYTPCFYQAPVSGIYTVVFLGPTGDGSSSDTAPSGFLDPLQTDASQDTSVAAWDVTVRNSLTTTADQVGRLFTYYLALYTGGNSRPINSTVYVLTNDGYLYETGLNGIDPNGFVVYGNRVGFLDSNGAPLNRDAVASDDLLTTLEGGITIAPPEYPIFFNPPAADSISGLGIPQPVIPGISNNSFQFQGTAGGNNSLFNSGGTFTYNATIPHVFELTISRDGTDFDPTGPQNRVLRGVRSGGTVTVLWDGLDNNGQPFPVGNNYQSRLIVRAGEYHFPLLDVENSTLGSPTYRLLNPPNGLCPASPPFAAPCTTAFYDDRGYRTANGTIIGTPNVALPGAPNPASTNFQTGFDSTSGARAFSGFGNAKGLDLWTYYPSAPADTALNIVQATDADLRLSKSIDNPAATTGQTVTFTLVVSNNGPANATNVTVREQLPAGLTFLGSIPDQGSYDPNTGLWSVGTIAANTSLRLQLTVRVETNQAIVNTAEIATADQRDPNSTPGNNQPNEDDQATARVGQPNLRLVKRVTGISRQGIASRFNNRVDDPTDPNDTAAGWEILPPIGVTQIPAQTALRSGDEVEYTLYFLSDGRSPVSNLSLCDQIPRGTRLQRETVQIQRGVTSPQPGGQIFSPLAPLPTGNPCLDQNNPSGTLLFELGDLASNPPENIGFVRFRVTIE